jgi:hypothetical protein
VNCKRCGNNGARHAWSACAVGVAMFYLCDDCDVFMNAQFLKLVGIEDRVRLLRNYRAKVKRAALRRERFRAYPLRAAREFRELRAATARDGAR